MQGLLARWMPLPTDNNRGTRPAPSKEAKNLTLYFGVNIGVYRRFMTYTGVYTCIVRVIGITFG